MSSRPATTISGSCECKACGSRCSQRRTQLATGAPDRRRRHEWQLERRHQLALLVTLAQHDQRPRRRQQHADRQHGEHVTSLEARCGSCAAGPLVHGVLAGSVRCSVAAIRRHHSPAGAAGEREMARMRPELVAIFPTVRAPLRCRPAATPVCLRRGAAAHERTRTDRPGPDAHRRTRPAAVHAALRGRRRRSSRCATPRRGPASTSSRRRASATSTASCAIWNAQVARRASAARPRRPAARCRGARRAASASTRSSAGRRCRAAAATTGAPTCDVIDAAALPAGYRVQLVPEEYAPGGVFERLTPWLDANMGRFGFYRPYASDARRRRHRALAPELLAGRRRGARGADAAGAAAGHRRQRPARQGAACSSACRRSTRASSSRWTRQRASCASRSARPA